MRLFASRGPLRGLRLLRRLLIELRGIRRACERQADALELAAMGQSSRESVHAQTFRSYERLKQDVDGQGSDVSYVDGQVLATMLAREAELTALLGRDPTPEEIMAGYAGEVEIRGVRT